MLAWVLTDGSADDEARCLGVAEAVADRVERRVVAPRAPWSWVAPFGPVDPSEAAGATSSGPISPRQGWPDAVIAAGRRAVPYLREAKRASASRIITVFLGDTVAGPSVADIVAVTDGSRLRSPNVVTTVTRPHRVSAVRLAAARAAPPLVAGAASGPRIAVLLGARRRAWPIEDADRLVAGLKKLADDGATLMAASRREAEAALDMAVSPSAHYLWDRLGRDPHVTMLAQADAVVVAGDDLLAVDEALAAGKPVAAFRPSGLPRATAAALDRLESLGAVWPFTGRFERHAATPIDATPEIARAIVALVATRAALRPRSERRTQVRSRETNGPTTR